MRSAIAIARKELSIYFTTVIGYAGFGAFSFLLGLVFISTLNRFQQYTQYFLAQQQPQMLERLNFNDAIIAPMFSTGLWMFLFFVPFLTMRLFAEEKASNTFELLMTAPVTSGEIVLGKFLGVAFMVMAMSAIPLVFPSILEVYGTGTAGDAGVEWTPVASATLSVFLLGLTFAALGMLVSALTESQIVSALLTFALLLVCFVLPMIAARIEGDWRLFVEYLSPVTHAGYGLQGRIHIKDLVFNLTAIAVCLFFTLRVVESHRWR